MVYVCPLNVVVQTHFKLQFKPVINKVFKGTICLMYQINNGYFYPNNTLADLIKIIEFVQFIARMCKCSISRTNFL